MDNNNADFKGFWGAIIVALIIGYVIVNSVAKKSINVRSLTESDTIYTEDSIYKVNFRIESVVPNKEEHEPAERN